LDKINQILEKGVSKNVRYWIIFYILSSIIYNKE
jgi:hypothetical protein